MIDTNALVYAFQEDSPYHRSARYHLERLLEGKDPCFLTWQVVFEFLRVVTHPTLNAVQVSVRDAEAFVEAVLASPVLKVLQPGKAHFQHFCRASAEIGGARGDDVHDVRIVALMREHDLCHILTADDGFRRFKGIRVFDPRRDPD